MYKNGQEEMYTLLYLAYFYQLFTTPSENTSLDPKCSSAFLKINLF